MGAEWEEREGEKREDDARYPASNSNLSAEDLPTPEPVRRYPCMQTLPNTAILLDPGARFVRCDGTQAWERNAKTRKLRCKNA